ncbi:MAG: hypothetical protein KDK60_00250 [Chlamydiia bacterium]|nr:hypothetical protein [Chlamydiia bacterium]
MKRIIFLATLFITSTLIGSETLMVDPHFSPYMGSSDLLFVESGLIETEDYFWNGEGRNTASKVWGRAAEQFLFWYPVNMMAVVTQHEFFGHGYRLREQGSRPRGYKITPFGGYTSINLKPSFPVGALTAVVVAGIEAEAIMARDLKMEWMRRGEIDGRQGFLYTQVAQSLFWYTTITHRSKLKGEEISDGNDVKIYIDLINDSYGDGELSIGKLYRWSLFNLLDPMTFYAYYAAFFYIGEGKSWKFPMISFGERIKYLPNIRVGYAPYAPEAYLENYFLVDGNPLYFYFKGGKRSFGFGLLYDYLFEGRRGLLGFRFDGWNQGVFLTTATVNDLVNDLPVFRPALNKRQWGAAFTVRGKLNLFSYVGLFAELGGKTKGYLPGYGLNKELVARVGLTIGKNSLSGS